MRARQKHAKPNRKPVQRSSFSRVLSPDKLHELLNGKTCVGDDAAQGANPDLLVVWDDRSGVRVVAAQNNVASGLTSEYKTSPLEGSLYLAA
jgi:hypothetical protein